MKGELKNGIYYKKLCIFSYMLKLQSSSKYTPFGVIHLLRLFFPTDQNSFWTHPFWCLLVLLLVFVSSLPDQQNVSLWGLFHSRKQRKVTWGKIGWIGRVGHGGHAVFHQKLLNTQRGVGRCTPKSPIMKWANVLKVFKQIHWSEYSLSQLCQLAHWYRWVPRTLT